MAKIKSMMLDIEYLLTEKNMSIEQIAKQLDITNENVKVMLEYAGIKENHHETLR